jgi:hypothetical protein
MTTPISIQLFFYIFKILPDVETAWPLCHNGSDFLLRLSVNMTIAFEKRMVVAAIKI